MFREIEKCVSEGKLDNLLSFCNSCVFTVFTKNRQQECRSCTVKQGIDKSIEKRTKNIRENEEVFDEIINVISSDARC
jgi:nucleosome binding factor SPN SPT16 subunit